MGKGKPRNSELQDTMGQSPGSLTSQQALNGQQDRPDVVERRPLVLEDVQADVALRVHVGVVAGGEELDSGGIVGIPIRKLQGKLIPQVLVHLGEGGNRVSRTDPGPSVPQGGQADPWGPTAQHRGAGP